MPKVSVIVPIYNVEKYLAQCLDSLLAQTERGFRVVLVNDGSTDGSGQIARGYAEKYPELFTYYEQENKGLGAARNAGLDLVETPYVNFLDSDDWWKPRCAEAVTRCIKATDPDLVFTFPTVRDEVSKEYYDWRDNEYVEEIFSGEEGVQASAGTNTAEPGAGDAEPDAAQTTADKPGADAMRRVISPADEPRIFGTEASVCRLFIRTQILHDHGFSFPEGIKWEDVPPHFQIISWCPRCVMCRDAGFVYRVNSGGQITAGGGAARLDIVRAYSLAVGWAEGAGASGAVKAYIFDMLVNFIQWFLRETDAETYPVLVDRLHSFLREIPGEYCGEWKKQLQPGRKRRAIIAGLTSPFYKIMKDPVRYDFIKRLVKKAKGMLRR